MKLLVTGGGGFVLAHLARAWVLQPGNRAVVFDLGFDDAVRDFLDHPRIERVPGSVTDRAALAALPRDVTHVVHGAAVTSIQARVAAGGIAGALDPLAVNVMGVAEVLAWAQGLPGLKRFINVSSGSVYARAADNPGGAALPETGLVRPEGFYALSKHIGEQLAAEAAAQGMPVASVRLSGVFGALDRATGSRQVEGLVKRLAHAARDERPVRLSGLEGGGDFLSAGEVARGVIALLGAGRLTHAVYNIAAGEFVTLAELAGMMPGLDWREGPGDIICDPLDRGGRFGAYDIARIREDTGWSPAPLQDQVASYLAWLGTHPA